MNGRRWSKKYQESVPSPDVAMIECRKFWSMVCSLFLPSSWHLRFRPEWSIVGKGGGGLEDKGVGGGWRGECSKYVPVHKPDTERTMI